MTHEDYKKRNEVIAKFIGWVRRPADLWQSTADNTVAHNGELDFHTNWNSLIHVITLIGVLPSYTDRKWPRSGPQGVFSNIKYNIPDMEKTHNAVYEFVEFYKIMNPKFEEAIIGVYDRVLKLVNHN